MLWTVAILFMALWVLVVPTASLIAWLRRRPWRRTTLVVATRSLVTVNDVLELDGHRFLVLAINQDRMTMTLKAL